MGELQKHGDDVRLCRLVRHRQVRPRKRASRISGDRLHSMTMVRNLLKRHACYSLQQPGVVRGRSGRGKMMRGDPDMFGHSTVLAHVGHPPVVGRHHESGSRPDCWGGVRDICHRACDKWRTRGGGGDGLVEWDGLRRHEHALCPPHVAPLPGDTAGTRTASTAAAWMKERLQDPLFFVQDYACASRPITDQTDAPAEMGRPMKSFFGDMESREASMPKPRRPGDFHCCT